MFSAVICHMSCVRCHMSNLMCHMSPFYKVLELVVERSVINAAYPNPSYSFTFISPKFAEIHKYVPQSCDCKIAAFKKFGVQYQ